MLGYIKKEKENDENKRKKKFEKQWERKSSGMIGKKLNRR